MKNYIIVDRDDIQKRIEELEIGIKTLSLTDGFKDIGKIDALKQILSQSTPLIAEIEKSFDAGHRICKGGFMYIPSKRDYISNLKLDI